MKCQEWPRNGHEKTKRKGQRDGVEQELTLSDYSDTVSVPALVFDLNGILEEFVMKDDLEVTGVVVGVRMRGSLAAPTLGTLQHVSADRGGHPQQRHG